MRKIDLTTVEIGGENYPIYCDLYVLSQIQEKMTEDIADAISKYLKPKGVLVYIEAEHMCMTMRGVKKPGSKTVTIATKGEMDKPENRDLFFNMMNGR